MHDIRIGAVVTPSVVGDTTANLERLARWVKQARKQEVELICFPELNLTGYCNSAELAKAAEKIPGPLSLKVSALAKQEKVTILAGLVEFNPRGAPFASHCVFHPDGRIQVYRKLHLAPPETETFSAGDQIPVFRIPKLSFGIQLCYDAHFPELTTAMALLGAEVIFIAHASPRGDAQAKHQSWLRHLPARAFDNGVFLVACNQVGDNCHGLSFPGNAVVIGPSGDVIAKHVQGTETMLVADLQAADLQAVRSHRMRYFLPHRRPDLYRKVIGKIGNRTRVSNQQSSGRLHRK